MKFKTGNFVEWAHDKDPTELGRFLKEYVAESTHQGWDGFSRHDLTGIRKMLEDMIQYFDSAKDVNPDTFKELSSVNPK